MIRGETETAIMVTVFAGDYKQGDNVSFGRLSYIVTYASEEDVEMRPGLVPVGDEIETIGWAHHTQLKRR